MLDKPRIVRCTIEMELIKGEHFNISGMALDDQQAEYAASVSFVDTIQTLVREDDPMSEFTQTKIIEGKS